MKILAVSDRVLPHLYHSDVAEVYGDVDLLVGCGDLPFYYLDFLTSALDVQMLYVLGNHDSGVQYTSDRGVLKSVRGGRNIHGRVVEEAGLLVAGLEGSMRYRPKASLMYSEGEMALQAARLLPSLWRNQVRHGRALDILLTHSPPWGIHDQPDRAHTGFLVFRWLLRLFRPAYLLHGHIHRYRSDQTAQTLFHHTQVINVYPMRLLNIEPPSGSA